jgi:hypothetical protein
MGRSDGRKQYTQAKYLVYDVRLQANKRLASLASVQPRATHSPARLPEWTHAACNPRMRQRQSVLHTQLLRCKYLQCSSDTTLH